MSRGEIWKKVPGYPNYQVSSLGRIKSVRSGILRGTINTRSGYRQLQMYAKGIPYGRTTLIHRLVLYVFRGRPRRGQEAAHLNGIRSDARLANLRWVSHIENESHKVLHGTLLKGDAHQNSVINSFTAKLIKQDLSHGALTCKRIAERYGCSVHVVKDISRKRTWTHI